MRNVKSSYWSKALFLGGRMKSSIPLFKRQTFPEALDYAVFLLITILAIIVLCSGCRANAAPDSGFLHDATLMTPNKNVPFNRMYLNPKFKEAHFTKVYVAPVNTDYVMAQNVWEKATLANINKQDVQKNVDRLADYMRSAFIKAFQNDPGRHFSVVDKPGPDTLILEMAIVQLVPSKVELQALSLVPVGFVGLIGTGVMEGGSVLTHSEDHGKGVIAMEARTRDGSSGQVVCMFADREHPPASVLDLKALFWWEPAKPICDAWARQFVHYQSSPPGTKINEMSNFELLVW